LPLRTGAHYLFKYGGAWDTSPGPLVLASEESTQPPPWGLMADGIVGWHSFDAEAGFVPDELSPSIILGGGAGRIVVLAATPLAQAEGWASRAVVAIARSWAQETLRIFLMDLGLDAPSLHQALGLLNHEGVSDAFLYGASVQRIAQPALGDAIFFASAGTASSDPAQILGHPRWSDLAGGFSEADATLLLFLPTDIPGADKILSRATDVLFLAGEGEPTEIHLGPAAIKVVAMLGPMGSPSEAVEQTMAGLDPAEEGSGMELGGTFDLSDDLLFEDGMGGDAPTLELDRSLKLAEGFVAEAGRDDFEIDDFKGDDSESDDFGDDEPQLEPYLGEDMAGGLPQDGESAFESADPVPRAFEVGGLVSDHLAGEATQDEPEFGDQGILAQEVPDFGAEFADLPGVDDETEAAGGEGQFAGEIVMGSEIASGYVPDSEGGGGDLGPPATEGVEGTEGVAARRGPLPPDRPRPMPKRRPPPKKRFPLPLMVGAVGVLAVLIAIVLTAAGIFNVPGFGWLQGLFGEDPYPELTLEGLQPNEPILRFSLELDVYEEGELGIALEMRNTLRDRLPSLIFNLTPMESEGVVTYALHAGPAADVVEAENLRVPLGEVLTRENPESWRIRETPRAFYLGETGTLAEAQEFLASAEADGVLGYILHVTYSNGTEGYEILSGAFEGVSEARGWQLTLRRAGRDVPLIERRGRPPE
jgi:hypothetical protein